MRRKEASSLTKWRRWLFTSLTMRSDSKGMYAKVIRAMSSLANGLTPRVVPNAVDSLQFSFMLLLRKLRENFWLQHHPSASLEIGRSSPSNTSMGAGILYKANMNRERRLRRRLQRATACVWIGCSERGRARTVFVDLQQPLKGALAIPSLASYGRGSLV